MIFTLGNLTINIPFVFLLDFGEATDLENFIDKLSFVEQIISIAILPAIFEEFVFRYPLHLKNYSVDIIFLCTIPFSMFSLFNFSQKSFYLGALVLVLYVISRKRIKPKFSNKKNLTFVFYGTSFLFAISHLGNFSSDPLITTIILLLLSFVSALFFGLIRIHIGFKYAVLSHFFYNATIVALSYVAP